jgi:hypothetical protein
LIQRLKKPGVTKGGQIVIVSDVHRIRPRAYMHRHKLHPKTFSVQGQNEVKLILDRLDPLIISVENMDKPNAPRPIFRQAPHITWDNFFSGEEICVHAGQRGYGMTTTLRRDRTPNDIPKKYLCVKQTDPSNKRARVAKFLHPIVLTKKIDDSNLLQMTSFQSTSSCNFLSVNAYNSCSRYVRQKERGNHIKGTKRVWCIEMNDARDLYLHTYNAIDRLDHYITNCRMSYRTWKYWHAPMIHAKAMAIVIAYDMYLECCEGNLDPTWKVDKPVDFFTFRERLALQMLHYNPSQQKLPGDEKFRLNTSKPKAQRTPKEATTPGGPLFFARCRKRKTRDDSPISSMIRPDHMIHARDRLCGDLTHLNLHINAKGTYPQTNTKVCAVCKKLAHEYCMKCNVALHYTNTQEGLDAPCFFLYHDTCYFGLAEVDRKITGARKSDFVIPDWDTRFCHATKMREIHDEIVSKKVNFCTNTTLGEIPIDNSDSIPIIDNSDRAPQPEEPSNNTAPLLGSENSNSGNTLQGNNGIRVIPGVGEAAAI